MITLTKGNIEQFLAAQRALFETCIDTETSKGRATLSNLSHDQLKAVLAICDAAARGHSGMENTVVSCGDTYRVNLEGVAKDLAVALVQIGFATDVKVDYALNAIIA